MRTRIESTKNDFTIEWFDRLKFCVRHSRDRLKLSPPAMFCCTSFVALIYFRTSINSDKFLSEAVEQTERKNWKRCMAQWCKHRFFHIRPKRMMQKSNCCLLFFGLQFRHYHWHWWGRCTCYGSMSTNAYAHAHAHERTGHRAYWMVMRCVYSNFGTHAHFCAHSGSEYYPCNYLYAINRNWCLCNHFID